MIIGLIDVDGHHFPNLCLMKISSFYKLGGVLWNGTLRQERCTT